MDTIFALASAPGKSGVAVIRISGPEAWRGLEKLVRDLPVSRRAALREIVWDGAVIDQALVLCFDKGTGFTGEEACELQVHGSPAIVSKVLNLLGNIEGFRLAEAGEFTRRAFENGRLDLTQVEGLSDLIEAETEAQRRQAMRVFSGRIGQSAEAWRRDLIRARALVEATIDFSDEDVPLDVTAEVTELVDRVRADLLREQEGYFAAERIRHGFEVAIVGAPNAGKSTLLNALAGREAAITSEIAGTTRDVIEVRMDIAGFAVTLLDTAGLRETSDPIETIGVQRAVSRAEMADIRVFLKGDEDALLLEPRPIDIVVQGKADLLMSPPETGLLYVSGKTGVGIDGLVSQIGSRVSSMSASAGLMIRERHRLAISEATRRLDEMIDRGVSVFDDAEIAAEYLRDAVSSLDSLIGKVDVEDYLDEVFSSFCIGK